MSKALLITYYFPPAGGPGVHRWLRFSKYFKENNWDLTVYCPEEAAWPVVDHQLVKEIPSDIKLIRKPIFEPHKYLQKKAGFEGGAGIGSQKKRGIVKNLMIWVRGNLFIPDSRKFWIRPSTRFLNQYLKQHPEITHIISTGPPHSMHLIAQGLKKKHLHLKWVADFRDPWTEIDYYQELLPSKWVDEKHKKLEKAVLTEADLIISVSDDCAHGLERIGGKKVEVITNGFIFPEFDAKAQKLDAKFTISHFGSMPASRNPIILWKALAVALRKNTILADHLKINLYGSVDYSITESLNENGLSAFYNGSKNVSHSESLQLQRTTQILLLIANKSINSKGILTGKFFEYLGAKRPMLVIGQSNSDLEKVVHETESGCFVDYDDLETTVQFIENCFQKFLAKDLYSTPVNTEQFHSKTVTEKYLDLINQL